MTAAVTNGAPAGASQHDPPFMLFYGDPKLGKTGAIACAYPDAEWIAEPGATDSASTIYGIEIPKHRKHPSTDIEGATAIVREIARKDPRQRPTALGIDDFSQIVQVQVRKEDTEGGHGRDGRKKWAAIASKLTDFRTAARRAGLPVILNCHELKPVYALDDKQQPILHRIIAKGGPAVPGQMKEGLPAACDVVIRAFRDTSRFSLWPTFMQNSPSHLYLIGNRFLPPIDPIPMNLREMLLAAGRSVKEPVAGHDETCEKIALRFLSAQQSEWEALATAAMAALIRKYASDGKRAMRVLRDAIARAQMRRQLADYYSKPEFFGIEAEL